MFYYGGLDLTYLVFAVPALLLGLWAQSAVKSRFSKYDKILTKKGITGAQAAAILLKANGWGYGGLAFLVVSAF